MNICALSGLIHALRGPLPAGLLSIQSQQLQPDQPVCHLFEVLRLCGRLSVQL